MALWVRLQTSAGQQLAGPTSRILQLFVYKDYLWKHLDTVAEAVCGDQVWCLVLQVCQKLRNEAISEKIPYPYHLCVAVVGCEGHIVGAMVIRGYYGDGEEKKGNEKERIVSTTHCKPLGWTGSSTTLNPRRLLYKQPVGKNALFMPEFLCCEAWKITQPRVLCPPIDILGHSDWFSELVQWFPVTSKWWNIFAGK